MQYKTFLVLTIFAFTLFASVSVAQSAPCVNGPIPGSGACDCGGTTYNTGYCCNSIYSSSSSNSCSSPAPQCSEGAVPGSGCLCSGYAYTSGYCCKTSLQSGLVWAGNTPCTQTCPAIAKSVSSTYSGVCCSGSVSDCKGSWSGQWATDCQGYVCCIGTAQPLCTGTSYGEGAPSPTPTPTSSDSPPLITSVSAVPSPQYRGLAFTLSAKITDDIKLTSASWSTAGTSGTVWVNLCTNQNDCSYSTQVELPDAGFYTITFTATDSGGKTTTATTTATINMCTVDSQCQGGRICSLGKCTLGTPSPTYTPASSNNTTTPSSSTTPKPSASPLPSPQIETNFSNSIQPEPIERTVRQSCDTDQDCTWLSTNSCPESAGASWSCNSLLTQPPRTPSSICPQVLSPRPDKNCGCVQNKCIVYEKVKPKEPPKKIGHTDVDSATLLGIVIQIEQLKIKFDFLKSALTKLGDYHTSKGDADTASRWYDGSKMLDKTITKLDDLKKGIRDKISTFDLEDLKNLKKEIKGVLESVTEIIKTVIGSEAKESPTPAPSPVCTGPGQYIDPPTGKCITQTACASGQYWDYEIDACKAGSGATPTASPTLSVNCPSPSVYDVADSGAGYCRNGNVCGPLGSSSTSGFTAGQCLKDASPTYSTVPTASPSSSCGAGWCGPGETYENCPQDCPTPGQVGK